MGFKFVRFLSFLLLFVSIWHIKAKLGKWKQFVKFVSVTFSHSQFKDLNVAVSETLLTYLTTLENAVAAKEPYMACYDGKIYKLVILLMIHYCT